MEASSVSEQAIEPRSKAGRRSEIAETAFSIPSGRGGFSSPVTTTLRKHFREELMRGPAEAMANVRKTLFQMATSDCRTCRRYRCLRPPPRLAVPASLVVLGRHPRRPVGPPRQHRMDLCLPSLPNSRSSSTSQMLSPYSEMSSILLARHQA